MPKGKGKQKQREETYEKENETPVPAVRPSKFKEATMNSVTSIHAPPDEMWKDLGIEHLIDEYNEENRAPAALSAAGPSRVRTHKKSVSQSAIQLLATPAPDPPPAPASEGPLFGRFSRAVASFFNGAGASFSALGKRKAGNENAEKDTSIATGKSVDRAGEDRKREAEAAYKEAKELGLLPAPKVFVRPISRARKNVSTPAVDTPTPTPAGGLVPPMTPTLYKSPSKKDLHKQKKLSKRVSDLEYKLAEARRELTMALTSPNAPPVPPLPATLPSPPNSTNASMSHTWSENEQSPQQRIESTVQDTMQDTTKVTVKDTAKVTVKDTVKDTVKNDVKNDAKSDPAPKPAGKIVKKRKAVGDDDAEFKPIATESDVSMESERETKRSKPTPPKKLKRKTSTRLVKKKPSSVKEEVVVVVPDGVAVPPLPKIPKGVKGKRAAVNDDGYGGYEHEMF